MTADEFWSLIQSTRPKKNPEQHVDKLIETLAAGGESLVLDFSKWWFKFHGAAYRWDLWGAAYIMNGGCSDDGFTDFRSWLVLQGNKVYHTAIKDPDSLANVDVRPDDAAWECYPGPTAFEKATGKDADAFYAALEAQHGPLPKQPELGEGWDFEDTDEMNERYPKLSKKYAE
jgi:hypothetical protein